MNFDIMKFEEEFIYLEDEELLSYNSTTDEKLFEKKKYRNVYCVNCGEKGHVVKDCYGPITSFGILAFKVVANELEASKDKENMNGLLKEILSTYLVQTPPRCVQKETFPLIKYLMIQRKDTMGYIDFVRGKYPDNDNETKMNILNVCLSEMTHEEKNNLVTMSFDDIWSKLWINHSSRFYKTEYELAKKKFESLSIKRLVDESETMFTHTEFGFPKGRRNMKETNIACAEREFYEETGYDKTCYDFIKNYPTIHEEFIGTNGIRYRHIYYLVKMKDNIDPPRVDASNIVQTGEVKNIGWFSFSECVDLIRPYDTAKKGVIEKVNQDILDMKNTYICSNFYYNSKRQHSYFRRKSPPHHDYSLRNRYQYGQYLSRSVP
jgi:ADP-ribose pyrophosphatase YjhB (NUDIX family)